jgi:hypothetical protein
MVHRYRRWVCDLMSVLEKPGYGCNPYRESRADQHQLARQRVFKVPAVPDDCGETVDAPTLP